MALEADYLFINRPYHINNVSDNKIFENLWTGQPK